MSRRRLARIFWIGAAAVLRGNFSDTDGRISSLDGVELVVTSSNEGFVVELAQGERLLLRRRATR